MGKKKLAIVGGAPSWSAAPFFNDEYEVWALGNQMDRYQDGAIDLIFEIHDDLSEHHVSYPEWLKKFGVPIVVGKDSPIKGENVVLFPFYEARELMGSDKLTSSLAYMMAYALLNGYTDISIYGVEMDVDDHEYFLQRPVMYAWIAYAKAKGVIVNIEGNLFTDKYIEGQGDNPTAGLPPFTTACFQELIDDLDKNKADVQSQIEALQTKFTALDGAQQAYRRMQKISRAVESGIDVKDLRSKVVLK